MPNPITHWELMVGDLDKARACARKLRAFTPCGVDANIQRAHIALAANDRSSMGFGRSRRASQFTTVTSS